MNSQRLARRPAYRPAGAGHNASLVQRSMLIGFCSRDWPNKVLCQLREFGQLTRDVDELLDGKGFVFSSNLLDGDVDGIH